MAKVNSMPGAPSELDLAKTHAAAQTQKGPTDKYVWYTSATSKQADVEYPVVPFLNDQHADLWSIKNQNAGKGLQVMFTDSDAEYQLRQRDQDEQARFDAWVSNKFDLTDPAQQQMLQQIIPGLYQRREDLINYLTALQTQYAKIRLRGAKSEEDLRFQWLIDTGRIKLPAGPIWDPKAWRNNESNTAGLAYTWRSDKTNMGNANNYRNTQGLWMLKRYQKGYFNPIRWLGEEVGSSPDTQNWFNIAGTGDKSWGPIGVYERRNVAADTWVPNYKDFPNITETYRTEN